MKFWADSSRLSSLYLPESKDLQTSHRCLLTIEQQPWAESGSEPLDAPVIRSPAVWTIYHTGPFDPSRSWSFLASPRHAQPQADRHTLQEAPRTTHLDDLIAAIWTCDVEISVRVPLRGAQAPKAPCHLFPNHTTVVRFASF